MLSYQGHTVSELATLLNMPTPELRAACDGVLDALESDSDIAPVTTALMLVEAFGPSRTRLEARVRAGCAWLDGKWPQWRGRISRTVYMGDPYGCVLAQTTSMSYEGALDALDMTGQQAADLGFEVPSEHDDQHEVYLFLLAEAWKPLIDHVGVLP